MHCVYFAWSMTKYEESAIVLFMKILIGICGSVSAYRILDVVRGLVKNGHKVRVILTRGAEKFVVPQCFHYLGAQAVYMATDDFVPSAGKGEGSSFRHIELADWCDKFVLAPLSANTLAKLAQGEASDLLSSIFITLKQNKPIIVFPAMNTNMLQHPFVRDNFKQMARLKSLPQLLVHPTGSGQLACGEWGKGKLASVEEIMTWIEIFQYFPETSNPLKKILITTGATLSPLDPVRFLTNASSGLTGFYLAKEALSQGHSVYVIAGQYATPKLNYLLDFPRFRLERTITTDDMKKAVARQLNSKDVYISSAAVNDIEFVLEQTMMEQKMKKSQMLDSLPIKTADDILSFVLEKRNPSQQVVGFAAETSLTEDILQKKWQQKPVDLLVGTKVHNGLLGDSATQGFQNEDAEYLFF